MLVADLHYSLISLFVVALVKIGSQIFAFLHFLV